MLARVEVSGPHLVPICQGLNGVVDGGRSRWVVCSWGGLRKLNEFFVGPCLLFVGVCLFFNGCVSFLFHRPASFLFFFLFFFFFFFFFLFFLFPVVFFLVAAFPFLLSFTCRFVLFCSWVCVFFLLLLIGPSLLIYLFIAGLGLFFFVGLGLFFHVSMSFFMGLSLWFLFLFPPWARAFLLWACVFIFVSLCLFSLFCVFFSWACVCYPFFS